MNKNNLRRGENNQKSAETNVEARIQTKGEKLSSKGGQRRYKNNLKG
jgi:hypothetical protein